MKMPGWLRVVGTRRQDDFLIVKLEVRLWHPGFWWYGYTSMRDRGYSRLAVMHDLLRVLLRVRPKQEAEV